MKNFNDLCKSTFLCFCSVSVAAVGIVTISFLGMSVFSGTFVSSLPAIGL